MKLLSRLLAAFTLAAGLTSSAHAAWVQASDYVPTGGPIAAPIAGGQVSTSGWCDVHGGKWSVNDSNQLIGATGTTVSASLNYAELARCASGEETIEPRITTKFVMTYAANAMGMLGRYSTTGSSVTAYAGACSNGRAQSYYISAGSVAAQASGSTATVTGGSVYPCELQIIQTNASTTTITTTLYAADGTTVLSQAVLTDTTPAMQSLSGGTAIYQYLSGTGQTNPIAELTTYANVNPPATGYTLAGPNYGVVGTASTPITLAMNGSLSSTVTVTPSDGGAGGTFTPSSLAVAPLGGSIPSTTFTYTPASVGAKPLAFTNDGSLTNPAAYSYTGVTLGTINPASTAFHFSPLNWQCYGQRGCASGVFAPRTIQPGAYFCVAWTPSATSYANLLFSANANAMAVSYFLNGVLVDNVATTGGTVPLTPVPGQVNQLMVVARNIANPGTSVWGQTGPTFYGLEVGGLQVDNYSTPGVAPAPCQPSGATGIAFKGYGLVAGTSINVGFKAKGGLDSYLASNIWMTWQGLFLQGYDLGTVANSGSGIVYAGDSYDNFIPGLYVVTSAGYQAAQSRWYLTDAGISLLDANGRISAYGGTGTEPAIISIFEGTNDANKGVNATYMQQGVAGLLAAYRGAAPAAKITLVPDGTLGAGTVSNGAAIRAAMAAGAASFSDRSFSYVDLGVPLFSMIYGSRGYLSNDNFHPLEAGNALLSPRFDGVIERALNPASSAATFRRGFH